MRDVGYKETRFAAVIKRRISSMNPLFSISSQHLAASFNIASAFSETHYTTLPIATMPSIVQDPQAFRDRNRAFFE